MALRPSKYADNEENVVPTSAEHSATVNHADPYAADSENANNDNNDDAQENQRWSSADALHCSDVGLINNDADNLRVSLDGMNNQDFDSAILRYQEEISNEVAEQSPLVSTREDFGRILGEYINDPVFRDKLIFLSNRYGLIRRTRGDGNCFYRAFGFRLCELLAVDDRYRTWRPRIKQTFQDAKASLIEKGYSQFSVEDFCQSAVETLDRVIQDPTTLEAVFQQQEESDYFVVFLRLLTALALMEMEETFQPFLEALGYPAVSDFCRAEVEPMGRDCDQPQIMALAQILGVTIRIEYVDRNPGEPTSVIIPEDAAPESQHHIVLLYRPGHYDILYPLS